MAAGYNVNRLIAAGTTNATLVSTRPGSVNGGCVSNVAAYAVFLKLYDSATIPTAGAGTPKMTIGIPAGFCGDLGNFGAGPVSGVPFAAGIGFTITKLSADNDTTVLVAGDAIVNLFYQ
jgi:hypothetical protein